MVIDDESRAKVRMNLSYAFLRVRDVIKHELLRGDAVISLERDEALQHDIVECCRHRFERPSPDPHEKIIDTRLSVCTWCGNCSEKGSPKF